MHRMAAVGSSPVVRSVLMLAAVLVAAAARGAGDPAPAQAATRTVADGVYTDVQAIRGAAAYEASCSGCHRADLSGGSGPSLKEQRFAQVYAGKDLESLFTKIATTMPRGVPASLADDVYVDIVAHLLKENGFRAGTAELSAGALDGIRIVAGRPKPPPPVGDFSYVEVVGCLSGGPRHTWTLTRASEPIAVHPAATVGASTAEAPRALGTNTFHLVDGLAYAADAHIGHKMYVRGLLIKLSNEQRITISAFETLSPTCTD
jgi:S-disulfanyl-L-cysteine oxidoreductase SoxD